MLYTNAAVLRGTNDLRVERLVVPKPGDRQALVKVLYSGICRTQIMELRGQKGEDKHLPHLLGHEGYGVVIAIGANTTKQLLGLNVILSWTTPTRRGGVVYSNDNEEVINAGPLATLTQYAVVDENKCIPTGLNPEIATLFGCIVPTAFSALKKAGTKKLAVVGFGGVGSAVVSLALAFDQNADHINVIDNDDDKLAFAYALHPRTKIYISRPGFFGHVFHNVIECSGSIGGIKESLRCGKHVVFAGNAPAGHTCQLNVMDLINGQKLEGVSGSDFDWIDDYNEIIKKDIPWSKLIGKVGKLEDINQLFKDLEDGNVNGRILVKMEH